MLAYFDCFSGLAGDMIVAGLLAAGADFQSLRNSLRELDLPEFEVAVEKVRRAGISSSLFTVKTEPASEHRSLSTILTIIERANLSSKVKANASLIFTKLGQAEAKVHDCAIDRIHFHEVGAVDAIVDILGSCICLEQLGVTEVLFPVVPVGSGTVRCDHGVLPVPGPATAELLTGYRCASGGEGELTTPTGAAIVTALGTQVVDMPEVRIKSIGYGAGSRDDPDRPNVLRVIVGQRAEASEAKLDQICVLSCQVDDMTGEELSMLAERLFDAGALDVVNIPIYMKKSRPGIMIEVVAPVGEADKLAELVLRHSSSFGLRRRVSWRYKLAREMLEVKIPAGAVRVKLGYLGGKVVHASPEYEDCRRLSLATGDVLRDLSRQAATEAWRIVEKRES